MVTTSSGSKGNRPSSSRHNGPCSMVNLGFSVSGCFSESGGGGALDLSDGTGFSRGSGSSSSSSSILPARSAGVSSSCRDSMLFGQGCGGSVMFSQGCGGSLMLGHGGVSRCCGDSLMFGHGGSGGVRDCGDGLMFGHGGGFFGGLNHSSCARRARIAVEPGTG